jgi:hypothetical protein
MKYFFLTTILMPLNFLVGMEQPADTAYLPSGELYVKNETAKIQWVEVISHIDGVIDPTINNCKNGVINNCSAASYGQIKPGETHHAVSGISLQKMSSDGSSQLISLWGHQIVLFIRTLKESNLQIAQKDEELIVRFSPAQEFTLDGPGTYIIEEKDNALQLKKQISAMQLMMGIQ